MLTQSCIHYCVSVYLNENYKQTEKAVEAENPERARYYLINSKKWEMMKLSLSKESIIRKNYLHQYLKLPEKRASNRFQRISELVITPSNVRYQNSCLLHNFWRHFHYWIYWHFSTAPQYFLPLFHYTIITAYIHITFIITTFQYFAIHC